MRRDDIAYLQQASDHVRTLSLWDQSQLVVGFCEQRYRSLVERFKLCGKEETYFSLLSRGEQHRARLVLAMLRRHTVLLLDEPFANVDPMLCGAIKHEIELSRCARATVIVTHERDAQSTHLETSRVINIDKPLC